MNKKNIICIDHGRTSERLYWTPFLLEWRAIPRHSLAALLRRDCLLFAGTEMCLDVSVSPLIGRGRCPETVRQEASRVGRALVPIRR